MARISDAINRGLENLSTSPLGMASLGLLMQPSMSRTPINPFAYAAQGMQMGLQNRALKQEALAQQERARSQEEARRARLLMDVQRYQQEEMKMRMAQQEQARQAQAMQELMSTLSPEEARMAAVLGPDYVKQMMQQRMQRPTSLQQNLIAAGLQPGTPEFQQAMMAAINRPQVQIGTTDKPLTVSELGGLRSPTGQMLPYGTTQQEAARMGASPILPPAPLTPEQQMENKARESKMQMGAKYEFARQTAAREVARLQKFMQNAGSFATLSPEDRAAYTTLADAAANAIAKVRGTPGAEPPKEAIESARASLPSLNDLLYQSAVGDVAGVKLRLLLEELGIGAESTPAMPPPNQGAPVRNESDFQERLRKYVPSAR